MEPLGRGPSVNPEPHHRWNFDAERSAGERSALRSDLTGGRACTLFLNESVAGALSPLDRTRLEEVLTTNFDEAPATRSVWFALQKPLHLSDSAQVPPVVSLQVKGVWFDSRQPLRPHEGLGWRPEYYFADREATFRRFHPPFDPKGCCALSEAVREYTYLLDAYPRCLSEAPFVPAPVGWGTFPGCAFDGEEIGYVVLGLPQLTERADAVLRAFDELKRTKSR